MRKGFTIAVIIPTLNEEEGLPKVLKNIPTWVDQVIVADNGSKDRSWAIAKAWGAQVIVEPQRGYGSACQAALSAVQGADIVVFLDADASCHPRELPRLLQPILEGSVDFCLGSRILGHRQQGALPWHALLGNWLACQLIALFWKKKYTDLGPFRAISLPALKALKMRDKNFGWNVEMQIKAIESGLRTQEVPVSTYCRVGQSKISGTISGTLAAGWKILATIFWLRLFRFRPKPRTKLLLFTRYPEPGKAKTRLLPVLSPEAAAELQRKLTEKTLRAASTWENSTLEIRYFGGSAEKMQNWLSPKWRYAPQRGQDLGERLRRAFQESFAEGFNQVIAIGSDIPDLHPYHLQLASQRLTQAPLVLGPAQDGGYYCIGLSQEAPELFEKIPWGTERVLSETLQRAKTLGLAHALLPLLSDLDTPEDFISFQKSRNHDPLLSIIIPTVNEELFLERTLSSIGSPSSVETLVVDGGSRDSTEAIARRFRVKFLRAPKGRASQMNFGASLARGEWLLFLHADTQLPPHLFPSLTARLRSADPTRSPIAFAFTLCIEKAQGLLLAIEWMCNFRAKLRQRPYGDHGLLLRRKTFWKIGGFPDLPLMEDLALIQKLQKLGRIEILPEKVTTSDRRFRQLGVLKTTWVSQLCIFAYHLGVSPQTIARWYYGLPRKLKPL